MYLIFPLITSSRINHLTLFLIQRMLLLKHASVFFFDCEYPVIMDERIRTGWILVFFRIVSASANALVSRNGRNMTDTIVP